MDTPKNTLNNYVPGVCNIGPKEIQARKKIGWISLLITVVIWIAFRYLNLAAPWFLILFFPASMSATGFIQGFSHFCAGFGMKGLLNFSSEIGKTDTVSQAEFRAKDKKRAQQIFVYSILIGIVVALVGFYLK